MTPRRFGKKQPTPEALRQLLNLILIMRADLASIGRPSLCRSYGVAPGELDHLIAAEQRRRRA